MASTQLSDGNPEGTVLGQSSSDKLGFFGLATPIVQPATVTDGTDATTTQAAVNAVIDRLQALGLIASS
jgi:hypothetical protein